MRDDHRDIDVTAGRRGSVTDETAERRKEPRYPTEARAEVTEFGSQGRRHLEARMMNISKSGLRLRLSEPLVPGARVRVHFGEVLAFGEVRWCRDLCGDAFDAGVKIDHTVEHKLVAKLRRCVTGAGDKPPPARH